MNAMNGLVGVAFIVFNNPYSRWTESSNFLLTGARTVRCSPDRALFIVWCQLLLYVAASHAAVSAALVQEKQDEQTKKQVPIYFVSKVLSPSKRNYIELEKVLYAVLMASRKPRHYFQSYQIIVPSSQPLKDIIRNRKAIGRVGK
jgi:hypothetical protein